MIDSLPLLQTAKCNDKCGQIVLRLVFLNIFLLLLTIVGENIVRDGDVRDGREHAGAHGRVRRHH